MYHSKEKWEFVSALGPVSIFRIQKATESLRTFHPSADPCFDEFVLDTSREETLLKEICFGGGTTKSIPVILSYHFKMFSNFDFQK